MVMSCSEDEFILPLSTERIVFNVNSKNYWDELSSRSTEYYNDTELNVINNEKNSYVVPIYLHSYCEDNDSESFFSSGCISRGFESNSLYESMSVTGIVYDGNIYDASPNLFVNERIEGGGEKWSTDRTWPIGTQNIKFYAHSPFESEGLEFGFPCLTYTTPSVANDQKDILVGESPVSAGKPSSGAIDLNFSHALTSIKFTANDRFEKGQILSITLKNVISKANYNQISGEWEAPFERDSFTVDLDACHTNGEIVNINKDETTFMMIPQNFDEEDESFVEIKFKDGLTNEIITLSFKLTGKWIRGKRVEYTLSTNPNFIKNFFYCSLPSILSSDYKGNIEIQTGGNCKVLDFIIESYAIVATSDGKKRYVAIPFNYLNSITTPEWITIELSPYVKDVTGFGTGCYNGKITICQQDSFSEISPHDSNLRKTSFVSGPYNLSNSKGLSEIENTANCYVINAPGHYKIPLIYGNAIKSGKNNTSAYKNPETPLIEAFGSKELKSFVNHKGEDITSPYISTDSNTEPYVVWADAEKMIDNHDLKLKDGFLEFKIFNSVDSIYIVQSNAVIGIRDKSSNETIWSWHIWFTDYNINEYIHIDNYDFMPLNLGWCYGREIHYPQREYTINLVQKNNESNEETGENISIKIIQKESLETTEGNNTYYQWGRKDPFPGGCDNEDKKIYEGNWFVKSYSNGISIKDAICNPNIFILGNNETWCNTRGNFNLWDYKCVSNVNNTTWKNYDGINKTIYDPSPIGYAIPSPGHLNNILNFLKWDSSEGVFSFRSGNQIFIYPLTGYRYKITGGIKSQNEFGRCTTNRYRCASPNGDYVYHMCWDNSQLLQVHPQNVYQNTGLPAHPIREY